MARSYRVGALVKRFVRVHIRAPDGGWQAVYLPFCLSRVRPGVLGALSRESYRRVLKVIEADSEAASRAVPRAAALGAASPRAGPPAARPAACPVAPPWAAGLAQPVALPRRPKTSTTR
jgi:hypothetical protein